MSNEFNIDELVTMYRQYVDEVCDYDEDPISFSEFKEIVRETLV